MFFDFFAAVVIAKMRFPSKQSCTSTISFERFFENRNLFAKLAVDPKKNLTITLAHGPPEALRNWQPALRGQVYTRIGFGSSWVG